MEGRLVTIYLETDSTQSSQRCVDRSLNFLIRQSELMHEARQPISNRNSYFSSSFERLPKVYASPPPTTLARARAIVAPRMRPLAPNLFMKPSRLRDARTRYEPLRAAVVPALSIL